MAHGHTRLWELRRALIEEGEVSSGHAGAGNKLLARIERGEITLAQILKEERGPSVKKQPLVPK